MIGAPLTPFSTPMTLARPGPALKPWWISIWKKDRSKSTCLVVRKSLLMVLIFT
jgi:hypothetical protein